MIYIMAKLEERDTKNNLVYTDIGYVITILSQGNVKIIESTNLIWATSLKGNTIKGIDEKTIVLGNRIKVNNYSQVESLENVFAIGDITAMISYTNPHGHPMVAQAAIQQGKMLAKIYCRI